MEEKTVFIS